MWIQGNDYETMYSRFCGANGIVFYGDVIQILMNRRKDITYEKFHTLIDYAFRVPFRENYDEFVNCVRHIRGESGYWRSIPNLKVPYSFDIKHVRDELGLSSPKSLSELTAFLWVHPNYPFQSDVIPKRLHHYVFGEGTLKDGRTIIYDF
jgi:hypothetical protein